VSKGTTCNAGNRFSIGNTTVAGAITPTVITYTLTMCN
jgi:hypothetical protein